MKLMKYIKIELCHSLIKQMINNFKVFSYLTHNIYLYDILLLFDVIC